MPEGVVHRIQSIRRGSPMQKVLDIEYTQSEEVLQCLKGYTSRMLRNGLNRAHCRVSARLKCQF